jgi:enterochelin esterase-like enzyme/outer membrane protein assembly factor BamB
MIRACDARDGVTGGYVMHRNQHGIEIALPACVALLALAWTCASATDWTSFRGPNQDGSIAGDGVLGADELGLQVEWSQTLGPGYSGIVLVGDRLVTAFSDGESDVLVALAREDGRELWRYEIADTYKGHDGSTDGPITTPAVDDGVIYGLGPKGQLFAVTLEDGKEVWTVQIEEALGAKAPRYGFTTAPQVAGDVLFVQTGGDAGRSYAGFDKRTGKVLWSTGDAVVAYQSPVLTELAGRLQIVALGNHTVAGLAPETGEVLWSHEYSDAQGEGAANPLVVEGDRLLLTTYADAVLLKVERSGEGYDVDELWRSSEFKNSLATPVYHDGHFYGFSGNFLTCVNAEDGERTWKSRPPGGHGLIRVDDRLVVYTPDGALVVVKASPERYEEVARLQATDNGGHTWPVFADGKIFVRNLEKILRIGVTEAAPVVAEATPAPPENQFEVFVREVEGSDNKLALIDEFMVEQKSFPITEDDYVHFVYRGDAEDVAITGSMTEYQVEEPLERIEGTDFFYKSYVIEPGARWQYRFNVDFDNLGPDPANPRRVRGDQGDSSEVLTGDYTPPAHTKPYRGDAPGTVESFQLASDILENEREVSVYLPPGYAGGSEPYPLLVVNEGDEWLAQGNLANSLNNLIGESVSPLIVAFVPAVPQAQQQELTGEKTGAYVNMLADELVPYLREHYRVSEDPAEHAVLGYGTSAIVTARAPIDRPDVFGKAAVFSAYMPGAAGEEVLKLASEGGKGEAEYDVFWNRYELHREEWNVDLAADSRRLFEALQAGGYEVQGAEVLDSSGWTSWIARAGDILVDFFPAD